MSPRPSILLLLVWSGVALSTGAERDDFASLLADRVAIERVYYEKRIGNERPFEEAVPAAVIEKALSLDVEKEAVLKQVYGFTVTDPAVAEEVARIESTTRSPAVLTELKTALAGDPARFAR